MASKEKDEQDGSNEDSSASETNKEASRSDKDDANAGEGQISAIKKKSGEPDDNLRRRAEWFQKRHRG